MATSSFSLYSSLILCVICAFFVIQSTSNALADVCVASKNLAFCLSVLNNCSHQNLHDLTESAINLAAANASAIGAKIDILINQFDDQNLDSTYILCSNYYNEAVRNLGNAEQYLDMGKYEDLFTTSILIAIDAYNCQRAFELYSRYNSTIYKENDNFEKFSGIVAAAASLLLPP